MMIGYFDNAATTYKKPEGMYEYMSDFMLSSGSNVGRGYYESSVKSGLLVADTRSLLLSLMSAPANKTVVFTPSATVALNTVLFGIGLKDGDIVYISHFEHNAVLRPLYAMQSKININIKFLPMKESNKFEFDLGKIEQCLSTDKPKLVVISQVSNVLGIVAPIDEISSITRQFGVQLVVDGAQACGLIDCDLHNIDYYIFAGHKTLLGPTGIGGFICDKNTKLAPFVYGGTGVDSANHNMPNTVPERFEAGTQNLISIVGLNYSLTWLIKNRNYVIEMERQNLIKLHSILGKYSFIKIVNPFPNVSSIIACKIDGFTSDEFGNILAEHGICTRSGLHCAPLAHEYIGSNPEGLVRFSISPLTNDDDFAKLNDVLACLSLEFI